MEKFMYAGAALLVFILSFLTPYSYGQVSAKKSLPHVPIHYQGDTDNTILRRAKWMEAARKEGELIWWGTERPDQMKMIMAEFNKLYPFIKGTFWRGSSEEIGAKLELEHATGRSSVDIAQGGEPHNYPRWRAMGMLEKFTDIIPEIEKKDKRTYSKYGDTAQLGISPRVPLYNTRLIPSDQGLKNWEDLLNPKWKGQIALTTDVRVWYTLALAENGWGLEKTEDFLKRLKQQAPIWVSGYTAGLNLLIAGESKILGAGNLWHVLESQEKKAPVDWIKVTPIPITGSSITLQKRALHPNSARLFLEWLYSPQGSVILEKMGVSGVASPGSWLDKVLEGKSLVYRTEEVLSRVIDLGLAEHYEKVLGITPK